MNSRMAYTSLPVKCAFSRMCGIKKEKKNRRERESGETLNEKEKKKNETKKKEQTEKKTRRELKKVARERINVQK